MNIDHVLAVVPVTDLDTSNRWYESFFGRPADNNLGFRSSPTTSAPDLDC